MRSLGLGVVLFLVASPAFAATLIVSPTGAGTDCSRCAPCALSTAGMTAQAGDTVVLLDGTYQGQSLTPVNSGTSSAWITFQADAGAVPILDGGGGAVTASGVGSDTSTYVKFVGLVARNWASGFTNQWTGSTTEFTANGNWQYVNCIGDGNTRNGFAFNSTKGVLIQECIAAHNGTSATSSWSSGFQLYAVQGSASDNVVQRNVAFENMDNQKHTDGSGFIVDTMVTGVAFIDNLAFLNGGSCIRLTKSAGINIINNTCYHNGRDTMDTGPTNPGEIYFTDGAQTQGLTMLNNIGVASGSTQDPSAAWIFNGGSLSIPSSNKTSASFVAADGTNPDFHLASGSPLIDAGSSQNAPSTDIGFDPKCIKKAKPTDIAVPSWSAYSIDYAYIKSVGGVAGCWRAGKRPAGSGVDIGAYETNAQPVAGTGGSGAGGMAVACGGTTGSIGGAGGAAGTAAGGHGGSGAAGTLGSGGAPSTGGAVGTGGGGATASGGAPGTGGFASGSGGTSTGGAPGSGGSVSGSGGTSTGGAPGSGGSASGSGGVSATGGSRSGQTASSGGCSCAVTSGQPATAGAGLGALLLMAVMGAVRRRRGR